MDHNAQSHTSTDVLRFDCFEANLASGELRKRGIRLGLRAQSFQLLSALLEHAGQVVTREELQQLLWRGNVFVNFDNNLNAIVGHLREVLGDSATRPRFIETLPKRGYRFIGEIYPSPPAAPSVQRPLVVVLPFVNLTGDPSQEYFSDAMTDEVITALVSATSPQMAVIARTTAMHYKGAHKDVARIGRELNVDYVVEGGVRHTGDNLALNIQLVQTAEQVHVFAKRYQSTISEVFSLHQQIAHDLAAHLPGLEGTRRSEADAAPKHQPTEDPLSYNLCIQGRYLLERDLLTYDNFVNAKQCFEQAIERDPNFALAYHYLADLYYNLGFMGFVSPREALAAGVFHALHALELDSTLAETHALLAMCRVDYDWAEVRRELDCAVRLKPMSPIVRVRNAIGLMPHGRLDEAVTEIKRALEVDPMSLFARCWLAVMYWMGRRYDDAVRELLAVLEFNSEYSFAYLVLGQTRCMERKFDEAIHVLRHAVELYGGAPTALGWLGLALAQGGNAAEARSLLDRLRSASTQGYVPPSSFAWIHCGLGEIGDTFAWMDRAVDARDHMIIPIKDYAFLDPFRSDPRFTALLRKMNLYP